MQRADDRTKTKVLAAVARIHDPDLPLAAAVKLAEAGRVKPVGKNTGPVLAYINHGRWVADCVCNGSELIDGPVMVCGSCGMETPVKYPGPKTRKRIEDALSVRNQRLQNWHPDETIDELIAQNIDHGIFPEDF